MPQAGSKPRAGPSGDADTWPLGWRERLAVMSAPPQCFQPGAPTLTVKGGLCRHLRGSLSEARACTHTSPLPGSPRGLRALWLEPLRSEPETTGAPLGLSSHSPRLQEMGIQGAQEEEDGGLTARRGVRSGPARLGPLRGQGAGRSSAHGGDEVSARRDENISEAPGGRTGGGLRFCDGSDSLAS